MQRTVAPGPPKGEKVWGLKPYGPLSCPQQSGLDSGTQLNGG